ncbi:hypothetical protein CNY89_12035 [Amaricoccus sp. HAR-UPW-R2A-40]|nr:hypothetical protein CNY89_12035 [Amaricoccus sp. HAR-UPW-R2A-40]
MTKRERAKLRAALMGAIQRTYAENGGRATPSQIIEVMFREHPTLIDEAADRLVRASLLSMVNRAFKSADKADRDEMQIDLFGNREPGLVIPKSIAIPSSGGCREMQWIATASATVAEIDQYIEVLDKGIEADSRKREQLTIFRERIMELSDTDDLDTPIVDMLESLRARKRGRA